MTAAPRLDATTMRDAAAARRFLQILDPNAAGFTFQTFDDDKERKNGALARATSDGNEVIRLYEQGGGVFVTVNETNLQGRTKDHIIRVRAVWQEDDDGHGGPFPLEPSIVVESSPGHSHRYWLVSDQWPTDEQGCRDFAVVMERMVESYGSDKNAKDISRVLRLPGFLHRKDPSQAHMVRIVEASERRYTREEILAAFPKVERKQQNRERTQWQAGNADEERIREALKYIPANDRDIWLQLGMAIKDELGEGGKHLWDKWSKGCSEKYDDRDQDKTWKSFKKNGIGIGTLFHHAKRNGWSPPRRETGQTGGSDTRANDSSVVNVVSVVPWPVMAEAAYHGLAGKIVKTIDPHTESDPVAILLQLLTSFGNAVGRNPHYVIEADKHRANINNLLVGRSSKARKGTSASRVREFMLIADERWTEEQVKGGLSSGEGFIGEVRDEVKKYDAKEKTFVVIDPGVADKRLMIAEVEFGGALAAMDRHGNNLSSQIRKAWDGQTLSTLTKHSPLKATEAHVSISGHITEDELRAGLTRTDMASGFANRFLFACVKRSKVLPHGGNLDPKVVDDLGGRLKTKLDAAKKIGRVIMTQEASEEWEAVYKDLSAEQPGLLGAIVARAEAQVIRLALLYALLDVEPEAKQAAIELLHLRAALAVWEFCETSAARIFGNALGDPIADEILRALQQAGSTGMSRTAIRDLFGRNRSGDRIGAALALLMTHGRARPETKDSGGRPVEIWFARGA